MLPYANRVTKGDDYQAIVRRGVRVGARGITVSVREREHNDTPTRFGFIVSKRVGVAVVRNLIRRRLKAVSRELLPEGGSGFDIVYRVHPEAAELGFDDLRERDHRTAPQSRVKRCISASMRSRADSVVWLVRWV